MDRLKLGVLLLAASCGQSSAPPPTAAPAPKCTPTEVKTPVPIPCDEEENATASTGTDKLRLERTDFADIPGWNDDALSEAVPAFLRSCSEIDKLSSRQRVGVSQYAGYAKDWRSACRAANKLKSGDNDAARRFFEREFRAYAAIGKTGPAGKITGYYVQRVRASMKRSKRYRYPMMKRPTDLLEIPLSKFVRDGRGRRIWGRKNPKTDAVEPYPTRSQLRKSGAAKRGALLWVDDPVDAIFAEIQGSAVATMDDGTEQWIAFDGKNGRKFRGVGGILRRMGELKRGQGTMQGTRAWFDRNPGRVTEISDINDAKTFFKLSDRKGAIGTQEVVLTPRRSLAVDRAVIALSTPVWVSTRAPVAGKRRSHEWNRLLIAQDTGGSILGPIRGDIYWGADEEAADIAGRTGGKGKFWLLLPRSIRVK